MIVSRSVISRTTLFIATLCIASIAMADVDNEANNNIVTEPAREVQAEVKSIDVVSASDNKDTVSVVAESVVSTEAQSTVVASKVTGAAEIQHEVTDAKLVGSVPAGEIPAEQAKVVSAPETGREVVEQHIDAKQILEVPPVPVLAEPESVAQKSVDILLVLEEQIEISGEVLPIDTHQTDDVSVSDGKANVSETIAPADVQHADDVLTSDNKVNIIAEPVTITDNKTNVSEAAVRIDIQQTDVVSVPDNKGIVVTESATATENKVQASETTVPTDMQQVDAQQAVPSDETLALQKVDDQRDQEISTDLKNDTSWLQWLQTPEGKKYGIGAIAVITVLGVTYVLYKNRVPQRIYGYVVKNPIKSLVSTACVLGIAAFVAHQQGVTLDAIKDKICFPVQP